MPSKKRTAAAVLFGALVVAATAVILVQVLSSGSPIIKPDDPCTERPPLRTYKGVTLQPAAMKAFKLALRLSKGPIIVVQSYRSCRQQAVACRNICGNPNGCPGRCARPGTSYHQYGAAVDITQGSLETPGVIPALEKAGWCQSQAESDPGHFSYGGCH